MKSLILETHSNFTNAAVWQHTAFDNSLEVFYSSLREEFLLFVPS
jgi:hypothetical protein